MAHTEEEIQEAIARYKAHLKFFGINPTVNSFRKAMPDGEMYVTTLTAHNGYSRARLSTQGQSDVSQDLAFLQALELFYSKMRQENYV